MLPPEFYSHCGCWVCRTGGRCWGGKGHAAACHSGGAGGHGRASMPFTPWQQSSVLRGGTWHATLSSLVPAQSDGPLFMAPEEDTAPSSTRSRGDKALAQGGPLTGDSGSWRRGGSNITICAVQTIPPRNSHQLGCRGL